MKLKYITSQNQLSYNLRACRAALRASLQRPQTVRRFGQARLVKLPNGQHELIGGTDADRAEASEWASFFAHGVTFGPARTSPPDRRPPTGCAPAGFAVSGPNSIAIA